MDPAAALNILQQHARQKQAELAQLPPQTQAEQSNPTQQTIDMGAPTAQPPAPPVVDAAAEPEDVDVSDLPAPELLARVRKLQQDRTATYKQYDEALVACAPGEGRQGDPAAYATVVAKVTVVFDRISKRANACEAALRSRGPWSVSELFSRSIRATALMCVPGIARWREAEQHSLSRDESGEGGPSRRRRTSLVSSLHHRAVDATSMAWR